VTAYSFGSPCVKFSPVDPQKPSKKRIAVIPGDGIGQEVIPQALKDDSGVPVPTSKRVNSTGDADRYLRDGITVPPDGFAMLGSRFVFATPSSAGAFRVIPASRPTSTPKKSCWVCASKMDLYANVRPVRLLDCGRSVP